MITVVVTGAVIVSRSSGVARVSVLDVGQGDAILVEGSRGGRLLIDGGPDPGRLLVVLGQRIPPWDRRIDAVILSHPHEDHVAGLARLLDRYQVRRVFEPGMRGPGPGYAAWLARLASAESPMRLGLAAGDRLAVDDIDLRVLWPVRGRVPLEPPDGGTGINNVSVVLLGSVGDYRFLLAGDVEEAIDSSLLAESLPRLDLLKVAHHGSRTATTQTFVDAVRPRIAIASAGTGNPYGHPARATLARLSAAGARVFRTDRDGSVAVTFESPELTVRAEGGRAVPASSGRSAVGSTIPRVPVRYPCWRACPRSEASDADRSGRHSAGPYAPAWATILPMTIPGRVDAASLLLSLDPPDWFMRHARAVAEVAAFLAAKIEARGTAVDRHVVEAAGLLHDIDKIVPEGDRARALPHGDGSADWLTRQGHPELARAVAAHPVTRLLDSEEYKRWSSFASREERIVAYADKRAAQHLESMDARFESWRQRYPRVSVADGQDAGWEDDALKAVRRRADRLEADVCHAAGIEPSEVGQLRWTAAALKAARGAAT